MRARPTAGIIAGILAPLVYLAAVILGGVLTPGYSHVAGPVGALIMTSAPAAFVLIPLFAIYNALLITFAFAFRDAFSARGGQATLVAPTALAVAAIIGMLMLFYPIDPLGLPATEAGRLHSWLAGIASLATMVAVLSTARSLRHDPVWRPLGLYSYASLAAIVITGIWAATTAGEMSSLMGLAERVAIAAFLQWMLVVALALLRRPPATSS